MELWQVGSLMRALEAKHKAIIEANSGKKPQQSAAKPVSTGNRDFVAERIAYEQAIKEWEANGKVGLEPQKPAPDEPKTPDPQLLTLLAQVKKD